jgi:thiol-disulfide isomerase/thioredoxin
MRLFYRLAWTIAVLPLIYATSANAESLIWETSLERAAQTAAQSNRLVLVHFSASWCAPCKWMDAEVFSLPEVAAHIQANYVAVKLDVDQNQDLVKKYGVAGLPTDLILTPRGEVVSMAQGRADSGQYVARLNQVASKFRQPNAAMLASVPGGPSLPTANPPFANPLPPNPVNPGLAAAPPNPAPLGAAAPQLVPPNPAYGESLTLNGPVNAMNGPAMGTPQPMAPQTPPGNSGVPNGAPGGNANIDNAVAVLTQRPPNSAGILPPDVPGTPPMNPPLNSTVANKPPVNPPLALDGYCSVSLAEKRKWVPGDKRWGAYHQGRTYLFAGPEEQARFLANSNYDRYAPVASGLDIVVAADEHRDVAGKREHGVFFKDHVILFASEASVQKFYANPNYYLRTALGTPMAAAPGQQPR